MTSPRDDLEDLSYKADAFPAYARLRREAPVHRAWLHGGERTWLVARHADVVAAFQDPRMRKTRPSRDGRPAKPMRPFGPDLLDLDAPAHTRLRSLVVRAFTPRAVDRMRPRVERLVAELLGAAKARGEADLLDDFAFPLTITVIMELLGVPLPEPGAFRALSAAVSRGSFEPRELDAFAAHVRSVFEARRSEPRDDLVSDLVRVEAEGDRLSERELVGMVFLLLIAGHLTTVHAIGNAVLALLDHPAEVERLRADPAAAGNAFEEFLRYDGPIEVSTPSFPSEDVVIGGVRVPRGESVRLLLSSANHDEARFASPDVLDLSRDARAHVAFGLGPHYCLGAPLARLEGRVALAGLAELLPRLRLAVPRSQLAWIPNPIVRGLTRLPVRL